VLSQQIEMSGLGQNANPVGAPGMSDSLPIADMKQAL
jgi:hypothetical protein